MLFDNSSKKKITSSCELAKLTWRKFRICLAISHRSPLDPERVLTSQHLSCKLAHRRRIDGLPVIKSEKKGCTMHVFGLRFCLAWSSKTIHSTSACLTTANLNFHTLAAIRSWIMRRKTAGGDDRHGVSPSFCLLSLSRSLSLPLSLSCLLFLFFLVELLLSSFLLFSHLFSLFSFFLVGAP